MNRTIGIVLALMLLLVAALPAAAQGEDIVTIASGNDDFSTLVSAVQEAGLVETLQGEGPFTVFAPTNAAFAALPEGTLESLDEETLRSILTYHVVAGAVTAEDVMGMAPATVETVQGESLEISVQDGTVMVNGATVVTADIQASNGVIHVIDQVLLPPSVQAAMSGTDESGEEMSESSAPTTMAETGAESTPATLPETGADNSINFDLFALASVAIGLLLVVGVYVYRPRMR